jgi:cytochrome P450
MLLQARDETGAPLSEAQVRDEAVTLFLAGAETTAVALAWTLYLLAHHPEVAERIRAEVAAVAADSAELGSRAAALVYTHQVVKEGLRLYPPAWIVGRETVRDCTIGGFAIPQRTQVMTCAYWMHREPKYFPDPERFLPERWTEELVQRLPRLAYFPFGGGQRLCVGYQFATMELVIALATVVAGAELGPAQPAPVPQPAFTLRPRDGVRLSVRRTRARSNLRALRSNGELRL